MTHTTEQEQEQLHQLLELVLTELDRKAIHVAYMQEIDRKGKAFIEQAARRAKVAPSDVDIAELRFKYGITSNGRGIHEFENVASFTRDALARWSAAHKPPEAHVELPEPDAWRYTDARGHFRYRGARQGFAVEYPLLKPEALYTEQQVRDLLAAHGIKVNQ